MTMSVNGTGHGPGACTGHAPRRSHGQTGHDAKAQRQRAIRDLVMTRPIGSQREVVDALGAQGFEVTQATVSRDIAELGLVKAPGADGHVYVPPERRGARPAASRRAPASSGSSPTSPSASAGAA